MSDVRGWLKNYRESGILIGNALVLALVSAVAMMVAPIHAGAQQLEVSQFAGVTIGDKVINALRGCHGLGLPCFLEISPDLARYPDGIWPKLPDRVVIVDLRGVHGPGGSGFENDSYINGLTARTRWTQAPRTGPQNVQLLHSHAEAAAGGTNSATYKTNWTLAMWTFRILTPGQGQLFGYEHVCTSMNDCFLYGGSNLQYGGNNVSTDEGAGHWSLGYGQGAEEFAATISSIADNVDGTVTLGFAEAVNANTVGQQRLLADAKAAKVYTRGTVTDIAGVPPAVTGNGTAWATAFGAGARPSPSDLCFSTSSDDYNGLHFIVPIARVDADDKLTLQYNPMGANRAWPSDAARTGNYRIYPCATVADVRDTFHSESPTIGTIKITKGYTKWEVGDPVLVPLDYRYAGVGESESYQQSTPSWTPSIPGINLDLKGNPRLRYWGNQYASSTGAGYARFEVINSDCRFECYGRYWVGDIATPNRYNQRTMDAVDEYLIQGTNVVDRGVSRSDGTVYWSTSLPGGIPAMNTTAVCIKISPTNAISWCEGTTPPTGACATGSLYSVTAGTGSSLYTCKNSAWIAAN